MHRQILRVTFLPFIMAAVAAIGWTGVQFSAQPSLAGPSGGAGVVPLAITEAALVGVAPGDEIVLKYDATDIDQGNTSPIRIDHPGTGNCTNSDGFCAGVKFGSDSVICAEGTDATFCDGPTVVDTQPGNITGPTHDAIQYRLDNTDVQCDEFVEVFEDDPTTSEPDVFRIVSECNPYLEGGYDSLRVLIIPVIAELCSGSCEVTITGFALFFLEGFGSGGCIGVDCEIVGRFVRVNQNVGLLAGTFDPDAFNHFVRLVQ